MSLPAKEDKIFLVMYLDDHEDAEIKSNKMLMMKKIVQLFTSMPIKHHGRTQNDKPDQIRKKLYKLVLFNPKWDGGCL